MNTIYLDCAQMTDWAAAHDHLALTLHFPPWYGRNLDALFDLLCDLGPTRLLLIHTEALDGLGPYGLALLDTMRAAAQENPGLELLYTEKTDDFSPEP